MMKLQTTLLITLLICVQTALSQIDRINQKPITINLKGQIFNLSTDTLKISQYLGKQGYRDWHQMIADEKGSFETTCTLPNQGYYVIRTGEKQHVNVVFQGDENIEIYGDGKNIAYFCNFIGSDVSTAMNEFIRTSNEYSLQKQQAQIYLNQNPDKAKEVNEQFVTVQRTFDGYRSKFIADNRKSPALLPVLSTFDLPKEFLDYEVVAKEIIEGFPASPVVKSVELQLEQNRAQYNATQILAPGKEAPALAFADTSGNIRALNDLRGKVVLIDFWASWCGPCRRENPNVVKLYDKYNKDGFEIYSVSLDNNAEKWKYAIQKDNLKWENHVSDLKGWKSEAGRAYGVSSIPFTVLIDQEGKIIQTNLRGAQLEEALKSIFGH
ncbi:MAG: thioredoxin-like domain-containing protein [Lishizhenia sp.]